MFIIFHNLKMYPVPFSEATLLSSRVSINLIRSVGAVVILFESVRFTMFVLYNIGNKRQSEIKQHTQDVNKKKKFLIYG